MQHWGERGDDGERFLAYLDGRERRSRMSGGEWIVAIICTLAGLAFGGAILASALQ
jgi:hypothetical protein